MRRVAILLLLIATMACCSEKPNTGVPNPAAVYCTELGYSYEVANTEKGQTGYCVFPDGERCDAWAFFSGKCGQEWTYCERQGGEIKTVAENCSYSTECAVCILPDGRGCMEWDYFMGKCPTS